MMLALNPLRITRSSKRCWHRRIIIMRSIVIGGDGTGQTARRTFVIIGWLWARRSVTKHRWLYADDRPVRSDHSGAIA
jgi:hypothetical protein